MHEVDPGYLGYWSGEEVLVFLKSLLEQERGGTKAFANIGQAANLKIVDQAKLVQAIEQAVPNIFDAELNSHLIRMLQLHRKQIEQLKTLLT